jgi:signal transduction histidine kinase
VLRFPNIPESLQHLSLADHLTISAQRLTVLGLTFYFFVREKNYQINAEKRFSLLGRQAARVAHDLKGMIAAPMMQVELVKEKYSNETDRNLVSTINQMSHQISTIHESLSELSRLCSLDQLPMTRFKLSEAVTAVKSLYVKNLYEVKIVVESDLEFNCDRSQITAILSNLLSNSLFAFSKNQIEAREIRIVSRKGRLRGFSYIDNAGGFSQSALEFLRRGDKFTNEGSGMGLQIVRECAENLGAEVEFENAEHGAKVVFKFLGDATEI